MNPRHHRNAVKILPVLLALWIFQGCAQVSTQSRPVDLGRPSEVEGPPPAALETSTHEPENSVSDGSEASAKVASLAPVRREVAVRVEPTPMEPKPTPYVHLVRWKGETLSLIAQWYTASGENWKVLARANPGIAPNRIEIGDSIRVPESLLKKRKPMPFEFISPSPGRTRQKSTAGEPRNHTEEVVLFGPTEATTRHEPAPEEIELFKPVEIAGNPEEIAEETGLFGPVE